MRRLWREDVLPYVKQAVQADDRVVWMAAMVLSFVMSDRLPLMTLPDIVGVDRQTARVEDSNAERKR